MKIAALVPMRHNSERVPGKNYRSFNGQPLFCIITETLLDCDDIDEVVIDTDSPTIIDIVSERYPKVRCLERPEHLRAGETPMNDVLLNAIEQIDADIYLQTHSTNPLLKARSLSDAIGRFKNNTPMFDSLFSVTRLQTRLWDPLARAINHNPDILLRTQDLPPVYEENSCLYLFDANTLRTRHNRIGVRPLMHEIDAREAIDIDVELDFEIAEFMHRQESLKNT